MSISIYQVSPRPENEVDREQAVIRSDALNATGLADLQAVVDRTSAVFGTPMAAVSIVFRDWQYLIAARGMKPGAYRRSTSFCGHAIMTPNDILVVPDASLDARFAGNPLVIDDPAIRFYAGAPLLDTDGLPLGALCVVDDVPHDALSSAQIAQLAGLGREIVAILTRHAVIPAETRAATG